MFLSKEYVQVPCLFLGCTFFFQLLHCKRIITSKTSSELDQHGGFQFVYLVNIEKFDQCRYKPTENNVGSMQKLSGWMSYQLSHEKNPPTFQVVLVG